MYHTILTLRKCGESQRSIAKELDISKTTVNKYCKMPETEAEVHSCRRAGRSEFAIADDYIRDRLRVKPRLRTTRLYQEVKELFPDIKAGLRAFNDFVKPIKDEQKDKAHRIFSVVETEPGKQIQVDPGEMTVEDESGRRIKIYFTCFTLSYSRYVYVHWQLRPYSSPDFIKAHRRAFFYFEGVPSECVYDQTKLVVIKEKYGEVLYNEIFHQFALQVGFHPHICRKSDPQSKGKVERTIQEIKNDFLYGRTFLDLEDLRSQGYKWLVHFNNRLHTVTQMVPAEAWSHEKASLKPIPGSLIMPDVRSADKTGLISYRGNKYSVPFAYQRKQVIIREESGQLKILDLNTFGEVAGHAIPSGKGSIVKNNNHYRDYTEDCNELLKRITDLYRALPQGETLVAKVVADNPRIVRDQLRAMEKLMNNYDKNIWLEAIPMLMDHQQIKATLAEEILNYVEKAHSIRTNREKDSFRTVQESLIQRSLNDYMRVIKDA